MVTNNIIICVLYARLFLILRGCFVVVSANSQSDNSHVIFFQEGPSQSHKAKIFPKRFASSLKVHFVTHVQSSFCEVSLQPFTESIE